MNDKSEVADLLKAFGLMIELDKSFSDIQYTDFGNLTKRCAIAKEQALEKLYSDFGEKEIEREEILKDPAFIASSFGDIEEDRILMMKKEKILLDAKIEVSRKYYPVELFFQKQCEKKRESDTTFNTVAFAEIEKERIEGILEQIRQLSDRSYYTKEATYEQALKYIIYIKGVIGKIEKPQAGKDYSGLLTILLKSHIETASILEFNNSIEHRRLTPGTPKIKWIGKGSEARYFADVMNIGIPGFNDCFTLKDGTVLAYNDRATTKKSFKNLFRSYPAK